MLNVNISPTKMIAIKRAQSGIMEHRLLPVSAEVSPAFSPMPPEKVPVSNEITLRELNVKLLRPECIWIQIAVLRDQIGPDCQ